MLHSAFSYDTIAGSTMYPSDIDEGKASMMMLRRLSIFHMYTEVSLKHYAALLLLLASYIVRALLTHNASDSVTMICSPK